MPISSGMCRVDVPFLNRANCGLCACKSGAVSQIYVSGNDNHRWCGGCHFLATDALEHLGDVLVRPSRATASRSSHIHSENTVPSTRSLLQPTPTTLLLGPHTATPLLVV